METPKTSSKKYILLHHDHNVSHDDSLCYKNDKVVPTEGNKQLPEIISELKKTFYTTFLKRHFKNVVVLCAAGTSMDNGDSATKGKSRLGLWDSCQNEIKAFDKLISKFTSQTFYKDKDIEECLSYIILYEKLYGVINNDEKKSLRAILESKIASVCDLELHSQAPHKEFLNKLTSRKPSDPRVKLFTTNYDLLFEKASNDGGFIVIDGFSFTHPRRFSGGYFDIDIVNREKTRIKQEESFVSKAFHLYKLHGSVNWSKDKNGYIEQCEKPDQPLIIYPANQKYESSYEQPYFEMMSRFQQSLRKENTLLIVIGFGFRDKHIQNVIIEAVEQNPSFHLLIVNYNDEKCIDSSCLGPFFSDIETMQVKRNVSIVFDSFTDFTKGYPSNNTYREQSKEDANESV